MILLLLTFLVILGFVYAGLRLLWRLLVGKPKLRTLVAPEKFVPVRGRMGKDGIYELTEAQVERLRKAAAKRALFVTTLTQAGDAPKVKEILEDQENGYLDLVKEGLLEQVPETEYSADIKKHIKSTDHPQVVRRLTKHGFQMFINKDEVVN